MRADGFESPSEAMAKPGLQNVDAEGGDLVGHAQLFAAMHGAPGRLLAVAQGGVEEEDAGSMGIVWCG